MHRTLLKKILFSVIAMVFAFAVIEILLRVAAFVSPPIDLLLLPIGTQTISDSRLGVRPHPAVPGHDRNGFRNPEAPKQADVIALGDSHTYGSGVGADQAWPRKLEGLTGKRVYSMAFGGYGPVHSLVLWDEAMTLKPDTVVHGFYGGNDYYDSYNQVYGRGTMTELKTSDADLQKKIAEAEQAESIETRVSRIYNLGETQTQGSTARRFLADYSKTYGLIRRLLYQVGQRGNSEENQTAVSVEDEWKRAVAFADAHPQYCEKFDDGKFRTIFTSEYRLAAVNLEDPRIAEGLQISLRAIKRISDQAHEKNIRYVVLLIPSRENVFEVLWSTPTDKFRSLVANEERSRQITRDFLTKNGIEYIDSLPALREEFAKGVQPYFVSQDGHPNADGHETIARLLAAKVFIGSK